MSLALYRKYRPQKWADLTGQNHIKVTLQNEIEAGKISHAYLFTGPRGIGKTTAARLFAKAINCEDQKKGSSEPCGKCDACLELLEGNDLDVMEIDAASHTGVDNVRENIIANARFTPVKRKYKVFIIDEVHMLSVSAFNALLKILEEPPQHVIFILATTEVHKVPATIISRCQRFDFRKINAEDLIKRLTWMCQQENIKVDNKVLIDVARISEGCLRDAESLLGQILSLGDKEITAEIASLIIPNSNYELVIQLVDHLVYKNLGAGITLINQLVQDGVDLVRFTDELIEFLRKMMLNKLSGTISELALPGEDSEKNIIKLAQQFEVAEIVKLINIFSAKKLELKSSVIAQLPLEIAIIEYCQVTKPTKNSDKDDSGGQVDPPKTQQSQPEIKKSGASDTTLKNSVFTSKTEIISEPEVTSTPEISVKTEPTRLDYNKQVAVDLGTIKKRWHDFLVKLQDHNASLVFILKVSEPVALQGNCLKIGLKYPFHRQRLDQAKIREVTEKVLSDFFGEKLVLETALLDKDYDSSFIAEQTQNDEVELVDELPDNNQQNELINNLVKTFNGKIVE